MGGDGLKINGRRVLVDVERGRTVRGWLPRRLGGGLGGTRKGGRHENVTTSGRADAYRSRPYSSRGRERTRRDRDRGRDRDRDRDRRRERESDRKRDRDRDERTEDRKRPRE